MGELDGEVVAHLLDLPSAFDPPCIVDEQTPLWECPCRECWELEMDLLDDDSQERVTYKQWKEERS